jgi:hypothetical protein
MRQVLEDWEMATPTWLSIGTSSARMGVRAASTGSVPAPDTAATVLPHADGVTVKHHRLPCPARQCPFLD